MMTVKQLRDFRNSGTLVRPNEFDGNIIIEAWKYPPVIKIGTETEWVAGYHWPFHSVTIMMQEYKVNLHA